MNWEQTIEYIRTLPEFSFLVEKAYFDADLKLNVERFRNDIEFNETLKLVNKYAPNAKYILDIGCGNGISTIAFALKDYHVTAVEPDPSKTIGAGAIRNLLDVYKLNNVKIFEDYAEKIQFETGSFDIVYVRQAMHHAYDLNKFIGECGRVLKKGGILLTIRDHVIFDEDDKKMFLEKHPLQKFYGGENAFTPNQYKNAMQLAGLIVIEEIKYFENPINYFPDTKESLVAKVNHNTMQRSISLKNKFGTLSKIKLLQQLYNFYLDKKEGKILNEKKVAGRMYSYVCIKK